MRVRAGRYLGAPSPQHVPITPDTDPDARFYAEPLRGPATTSLAERWA